MNTKLVLFSTPMLMLAAFGVAAESQWCVTPYVGADAEWRHMDFRRGFGNNLFRRDYPQGDLHGGLKFNDYFGVEAGYEATERKTRTVTLVPGVIDAGLVGVSTVQYASTGQIKGPHLNLRGSFPLCRTYNLQLIGLVGFARLQAKFIRNAISVGATPVSDPRVFIQRKAVMRLGGGLEHQLNDQWGVRAMLKWEQTNRFKNIASPATAAGIPTLKLKNSLIYSFGIFFTFC